ncbi:MAG: hypothetical protein K1X55_11190 [Chitinophagales bacterium]|nr:hypothetical protein [Chitinophagales bacterium]
MEEKDKQLANLAEIRQLMERSSRFISLSGLSGVFAGIYALIGAFLAWWKLEYKDSVDLYRTRYEIVTTQESIIPFLLADACIVLLLSLLTAWYFTGRRAKKKGQKIFDKAGLKLVINLFIPLITGGLFCLVLLKYGLVFIVPSATLIFYGLALVNGSKFTLDEIRYLGICEIVLGLIASLNTINSVIYWAIGFGILHILYGLIMWNKYERKE